MVMIRPSLGVSRMRRFAPQLGFLSVPLGLLRPDFKTGLDRIIEKLAKYGGDLSKLSATERQLARKFWAELELSGKAAEARKAGDEAGALALEAKLGELRARHFKLSPVGETRFRDFLSEAADARSQKAGKRPGPVAAPPGKAAEEEAFQAGKTDASRDATVASALRELIELHKTPGWLKLTKHTFDLVKKRPGRALFGLGTAGAIFIVIAWYKNLGFKAFIHEEAIQSAGSPFFNMKALAAYYANPRTSDEEARGVLDELKNSLFVLERTIQEGEAFFHGSLKWVPWQQGQYIEFAKAERSKLEGYRQQINRLPKLRANAIKEEAEKKAMIDALKKSGAAPATAAPAPAMGPLVMPPGPVPVETPESGPASAYQYEQIAKAIQPSEFRGRSYPPLIRLTPEAMAAFTGLTLTKDQAEMILAEKEKEIQRREEARKKGAVAGLKGAKVVGLKPIVEPAPPAPAAQGLAESRAAAVAAAGEDLDALIEVFLTVKKRTGYKTTKDQNDAVRTGAISIPDMKALIKAAGGDAELAAYETRIGGAK